MRAFDSYQNQWTVTGSAAKFKTGNGWPKTARIAENVKRVAND